MTFKKSYTWPVILIVLAICFQGCKDWIVSDTFGEVCYRFTFIHEKCQESVGTFYGCENGEEYRWITTCNGAQDVFLSNPPGEQCFVDALTFTGQCQVGRSLPDE